MRKMTKDEINKKIIIECEKIIDYKNNLKKGCTCSNKDEHKRLGCVSLEGFIGMSLEKINKLYGVK